MTDSGQNDLITLLNYSSMQLDRYLAPIIFLFGTIGNSLNCLVLSQKKLRSNPCAYLFLISSFVSLVSILLGMPTRVLAGWHEDPTATNHWVCKLRAFIVFSTRTMAMWLTALASVDRWLVSSVNIQHRQKSNLKYTKREIIIVLILSILIYSYMLICYEAKITDAPLKCYGKNDACRTINDLTYAILTIVIPLIAMATFGILTIANVHHLHARVGHAGGNESTHVHAIESREALLRRADRNLLSMLLVQVLILTILCIPQAVQKLYISFDPFGSGSAVDDAIKALLYNIELLLAFIASGVPFYIYTLAGGTVFRKGFSDLLQKVKHKVIPELHF